MKKAIWVITTLLLSGLIPAGVAIVLKYNDLCSAAQKARFEGKFIQSIELASQASKLIPFLPPANREVRQSFSVLTNDPARILPNLINGDKWPEIQPLLADLHARLAAVIPQKALTSAESTIDKGIRKETKAQTTAALDSKQINRSIFGLAVLIELNEDIEELFLRFVEMAKNQRELPTKTFQNICRLQSCLPVKERNSPSWQSLMDRLSKQYASNTAVSVIANIKDVNVQPLRQLKKELPGELASYCSPEHVKTIYEYALDQIKAIAEQEAATAYDAQNLSDLAVKFSILANVGFGASTQETDAMKQWLNSYATWLKQEKYLTTHNLINSLRSNLPDSFHATSVRELIDTIILICQKKRGIKFSGETALTQAFQKAGFIVFPAASDKPVATFKLTTPQISHGSPSEYSSSGGYGSTATRYPATATMSGIVLNSEGRQVKQITVSNTEPTPTSISYRGSSSSSMDQYGSPTQDTIDRNAKSGLMKKMEAEIVRQAPDIRL